MSSFLSAYYLCEMANSPSFFSQNSPSLPQNSVSSLLRNSTLETVFRYRFQKHLRWEQKGASLVRGLLGTAPRTPPSNPPRPPLPGIEIGSNQEIDIEYQCEVDVESMPSRPLRRGGRGGFEGGVRGVCA